MDPSRLAELLAVLRDAGVSQAEVPVDVYGTGPASLLRVTLGPAPQTTAPPDDDEPEPEEDLPPGAYDPIAARKKAAK